MNCESKTLFYFVLFFNRGNPSRSATFDFCWKAIGRWSYFIRLQYPKGINPPFGSSSSWWIINYFSSYYYTAILFLCNGFYIFWWNSNSICCCENYFSKNNLVSISYYFLNLNSLCLNKFKLSLQFKINQLSTTSFAILITLWNF